MAQDKKDEAVNGPEIVAKILNCLAPDHRERLMKSIETVSPEMAQKIEENLLTFEDIAELTPQSVQTLLKTLDAKDLTLSLSVASPKVKETVLSNLSQKRKEMLLSDLEEVKASPRVDIEEAQKRVLKTLDNLRTAGAVLGKTKHEQWV